MKAIDVVNRLSQALPFFTDGFSSVVGIANMTVAGTTVSVETTTPHGLIDGDCIAFKGVETPVEIDESTFTRVGTVVEFKTLQDHDLTLSNRDILNGGKTIVISGLNEASFNGEFQILSIPNRRTIKITVPDSGPSSASGNGIVENAGVGFFNGLFEFIIIDATNFTYEIPVSYTVNPVFSNASLQTSIRITYTANIVSYLNDVYTARDDDVIVVQLGDVVANKSRNEITDAIDSAVGNNSYNPIFIQNFAVYVIIPSTDELSSEDARDKVEEFYAPAIYKSILKHKFPTYFSESKNHTTAGDHGPFAFGAKESAFYVHEFTFQQLAQLNCFDQVEISKGVAMREIGLSISSDIGTGVMTANVNLDEEPLP